MRMLARVFICAVIFSIPIPFSLAQDGTQHPDGDRITATGNMTQSGQIQLATTAAGVSSRVVMRDGKNAASSLPGAKCPHISEETPTLQAIAPQKTQTPEGSCIRLEVNDAGLGADPRQR